SFRYANLSVVLLKTQSPVNENRDVPIIILRNPQMAGHTKKKRTTGEKPLLTLRVKGPSVRSGRVSIPDLIRICQEAQNSVNRQAEAKEGFKTIHPGPVKDSIRKGCTLDLFRIGKGSTTLSFVSADPQDGFDFPNQKTFACEVISAIAQTIKSLGNGKGATVELDAGVLQGLYAFGGIADGKRITEIDWIAPKIGAHRRVVGKVNKLVRERVASRMSSPSKQNAQVDGILDMADFKPSEFKCRIDPAIGAAVLCTFEQRDASIIQSLMREPVRVTGEGTFQAYTRRLESLHIKTIERLPSLSLGEGNFSAGTSLTELALSQKTKPIKSIAELSGGFPNDEKIDTFLEEIYKARK